jgi:hypothetical protein
LGIEARLNKHTFQGKGGGFKISENQKKGARGGGDRSCRVVYAFSAAGQSLTYYKPIVTGNSSNNRPGDGSENELTPIQPSKHAEGSAADEPTLAPQHTRVSHLHLSSDM